MAFSIFVTQSFIISMLRTCTSCVDLKSFFQSGSNFDYIFFLVDEGREYPNTTISWPTSARQQNAKKWCFAGGQIVAQH